MTLKGSRTVRRGAVGKVSGLINLEGSLAAYSTKTLCANSIIDVPASGYYVIRTYGTPYVFGISAMPLQKNTNIIEIEIK